MASRTNSPLGESPLEEQLTPRSKVAKMLADIDNAASPTPSIERPSIPAARRLIPPSLQAGHATLGQPIVDDSSASDDDDIVLPRGKAARRMLGKTSRSSSYQRQTEAIRLSSSPTTRSQSDSLRSSGPSKFRRLARSNDIKDVRDGTPTPSPAVDRDSNRLFVSPAKTVVSEVEDLPSPTLQNFRRQKPLVKRRLKQRTQMTRSTAGSSSSSEHDDPVERQIMEGDDLNVDQDVEKLLSDAFRPARKASKKALEEMTRETQRMAREQALAHDMKVKKKFTTQDLFARFNFTAGATNMANTHDNNNSSSTVASDASEPAANDNDETPPSSPPAAMASKFRLPLSDKHTHVEDEDDELPDDPFAAGLAADKPKQLSWLPKDTGNLASETRVSRASVTFDVDSSDGELEVLAPLPDHLKVFDRARATAKAKPSNSCKAIHTLRHLSNIGAYAPTSRKKGTRPAVSHNTMEVQLRRKAKEQARQDELARIAELKALGIVIQTAEERENEAEVYENLLEKARAEALELRKLEKAAKGEGNEGAMDASADESEDEDYALSGSEDEEQEGGVLIDDEAESEEGDDADYESAVDEDENVDEVDGPLDTAPPANQQAEQGAQSADNDDDLALRSKRSFRKSHIVDDDDEEEEDDERDVSQSDNFLTKTPIARHSQAVQPIPQSQVDPFAIFDVNPAGGRAMLMSPTQAFNATMQTPTQMTQAGFANVFGIRQSAVEDDESTSQLITGREVSVVPASQGLIAQQPDSPWTVRAPETPQVRHIHQLPPAFDTPGWEPTQDEGLNSPLVLSKVNGSIAGSLADFETQSTVRLRISESPAPIAARPRGRLMRRSELATQLVDSDDDERNDFITSETSTGPANAFDQMKRRRREEVDEATRKAVQQELKGMMDDQAEESDDEYAGLGGDDYVAPETEQDKEMIDSSHIEVDERALAAHFAERQRVADEAATSKLFKDLTTGALRRKQANMFDLEDDEDEMAIRRRQVKQQEEARKRRLLLQDDNIAGLAEGKQSIKKDAFLKAIADDDERDDLSDMSGDEAAENNSTPTESQTPTTTQGEVTVLQEISNNKRSATAAFETAEGRPPAKMRRTQASGAFKKPTSILEVQQSVSFLLEEPDSAWFAVSQTTNELEIELEESPNDRDASDEDHSENDDLEVQESLRDNDGGFAIPNFPSTSGIRAPAFQRRTPAIIPPRVVDRLSLKRAESSSSSSTNRSAWSAPTISTFKTPSLLRRATTNHGLNVNDRGVSTSNSSNGMASKSLSRENSGIVKSGGTKRSSLAYQARAEERMAVLQANAKRRQENTAKMASLRRHCTVGGELGRSLGGRFE